MFIRICCLAAFALGPSARAIAALDQAFVTLKTTPSGRVLAERSSALWGRGGLQIAPLEESLVERGVSGQFDGETLWLDFTLSPIALAGTLAHELVHVLEFTSQEGEAKLEVITEYRALAQQLREEILAGHIPNEKKKAAFHDRQAKAHRVLLESEHRAYRMADKVIAEMIDIGTATRRDVDRLVLSREWYAFPLSQQAFIDLMLDPGRFGMQPALIGDYFKSHTF